MRFSDLFSKCSLNLVEINQLNPYFQVAFADIIEEDDDFSDQFYRSYRKSTDVMYTSLLEQVKSNKQKVFYYYLCVVCICHVFNDFYAQPELKESIFSVYLQVEKEHTEIFSYERFLYYLKNCEKETLLKLAKRIIDECMRQR